jgi:mannose-6-phosphate isomerase-like protein (cupin superfamily)
MVPATHAESCPAGQPRSLALTEFAHPAGFVSPLHVHHDEHEAFYILEGTAEVHCADEVFRVTPGQLWFGRFRLAPSGRPELAPPDAGSVSA